MLPYTQHGTGEPTLIFLHFFGSSQREWRHVIAQLCPRHCCIAADMAGFGEATAITGYSVIERTAQVAELIESFAPTPVILVAHSFSGKVAMVLSANPPANLKQTILVAPSPLVPEPITDDAREQMCTGNQTRIRAEAFINGSHYRPLTSEDFELAVEDVLRSNEQAWLAWPNSGSIEDWSSRITEFKVPTDLIVGEHDQAIPLEFQRQHTLPLVERSGGKLTIIPGAAHMLPNEAADELSRLIEQRGESSPMH